MYESIARLYPDGSVRYSWFKLRGSDYDPFAGDPSDDNDPPVNPAPAPDSPIGSEATSSSLTDSPKSRLKIAAPDRTTTKKRFIPFTRKKRQNIQQRLAALDTIAGPKEVVLLTGTLPGSTPESLSLIAEYSAEIVKKLHRWIRYVSDSEHWLYVWELQKRGALHIHFAVLEKDPLKRAALVSRFRDKWIEILQSFGRENALCFFARAKGGNHLDDLSKVQADATEIDRSVRNYLSKYLSKSAYGVEDNKHLFSPRQWSRCSKELLSLTESLTRTVRTMPMTIQQKQKLQQEVDYEFDVTSGFRGEYLEPHGFYGSKILYPEVPEDGPALFDSLDSILSGHRYGFRPSAVPEKVVIPGPGPRLRAVCSESGPLVEPIFSPRSQHDTTDWSVEPSLRIPGLRPGCNNKNNTNGNDSDNAKQLELGIGTATGSDPRYSDPLGYSQFQML